MPTQTGSLDLSAAAKAANEATKYITEIDQNGIKVHAENNVSQNYAKIDADGMEVFKGGVSVAKYGNTARIGKETAGNGNVVTSNTGMDFNVGTTTVGSLKQITNYTPQGSSETYDNVLQMHATEYFQLTSDYENSGVSKLVMETNASEGVRFHIYDEVEIGGQTYIEPASSLYLNGDRTGSLSALSGYIDTSQSYTNIGYSVVASDLDTSMDYGPLQFGINNWNGDVAGGIWSNRLDNWLLGMTFGGTLTLRGKPLTDWVVARGEAPATYGSGSGYWQWCEWASGKVELWYRGSMSVDTSSSAGGLYRRMRRVNFPNKPGTNTPYSLHNCMAVISGTSAGGWLNTGGTFNSSGQNYDPKTQVEVMAYRISSSPDALQGNVNIYVCGQQALDE